MMTAVPPHAPTETVYRCADGTPFPVVWEDSADAALTFRWNQDHFPLPFPPLAIAIERLRAPAQQRAHAEAGVPVPVRFRTDLFLFPHGFQYQRLTPPSPEETAELEQACDGFLARCGDLRAAWDGWGLPRNRAACAALQAAGDTTPLATLVETYGYGRAQTGIALPVTDLPLRRLIAFLAEVVGPEAERLAHELAQGYANDTQTADQALWTLARMAEQTPRTRAALIDATLDEALDAVRRAGDAAFLAAFEALLEQYGWRASGWDLTNPTWGERPATPLALVRSLVERPTPAPAAATAQAARRREDLIAETEARLPDQAARARFRVLLAPMEHYIYVREGRALWQLTSVGSLRGALLRHGARLVRAGAIRSAEDVYFLLPDEVDGRTGGTDLDPVVQVRRRAWSAWAGTVPPPTIGAGVPVLAAADATPPPSPTAVLRGVGASRGLVTARARLIADPSDADTLAVGEVLVCTMTTPEWTPLFGVAGAIVTDSGGMLSHTAIAAREYGIPAVIGTRTATTVIADGQEVEVDGTAGTVRF